MHYAAVGALAETHGCGVRINAPRGSTHSYSARGKPPTSWPEGPVARSPRAGHQAKTPSRAVGNIFRRSVRRAGNKVHLRLGFSLNNPLQRPGTFCGWARPSSATSAPAKEVRWTEHRDLRVGNNARTSGVEYGRCPASKARSRATRPRERSLLCPPAAPGGAQEPRLIQAALRPHQDP
jgi:hypothetical protein